MLFGAKRQAHIIDTRKGLPRNLLLMNRRELADTLEAMRRSPATLTHRVVTYWNQVPRRICERIHARLLTNGACFDTKQANCSLLLSGMIDTSEI